MQKRTSRDLNQTAFATVQQATRQSQPASARKPFTSLGRVGALKRRKPEFGKVKRGKP